MSDLNLPLVNLPKTHPCSKCGECCNYIAVEIDRPTGFEDYDNIYWYLCHKNVSVYIDFESDWYIEFMTACEHLTEAKTCGIYEERPRLCSDFSWDECEKTSGEKAWKQHFANPQELLDYMQKYRPKAYEKYLKASDKMKRRRSAPAEDKTPSEARV